MSITIGAKFVDFILGIKCFTRWLRTAIVTDVEKIRKFTDVRTIFMPRKYSGIEIKDLHVAID